MELDLLELTLGVLALLFGLELAWGCVRAYRTWRFLRNPSHVMGVVIDYKHEPQSQQEHENFRPVVKFQTPEGRTVEFASLSRYPKKELGPEVGQEVAVLYDPLRPERAEIKGANRMLWFLPIALIGGGIVGLVALAYVYIVVLG